VSRATASASGAGDAGRCGAARGGGLHLASTLDRKHQAYQRTERDLHSERAAALGRASRELEAALAAYAAAEDACAADPSPGTRAHRQAALAHAGERLWYLVIQREAIGLRRHDELLEGLRVPHAVRAAMGPKPKR